MSAQLPQAIQLAQAGQSDQARRMLRQIVRSEPNNEIAWLWLASVAADRAEYERAVNEALRINPNNSQAQEMLAQLRQQQAARPRRARSQPAVTRGGLGRVLRRALIVGLIVAVVGVVIFLASSLLSGEEGKTVKLEIDDYQVALKVPESWEPAIRYDADWEKESATLNQELPFNTTSRNMWDNWRKDWSDVEVRLESVTPPQEGEDDESTSPPPADMSVHLAAIDDADVYIVETDVDTLKAAGAPISVVFIEMNDVSRLSSGPLNLTCDQVDEWINQLEQTRTREIKNIEAVKRGSFCGLRIDRVDDLTVGDPDDEVYMIFEDVAPPTQRRSIVFYMPVSRYEYGRWLVTLPENQYDSLKDEIKTMIKSAKISQP